MRKYQKSRSTTELCRMRCRKISGLRIRHSVMDAVKKTDILQIRLYIFTDAFHRLGGPKGIIRQCEFFLYSKKDRDAVYKCMEKGYKFPEITSWIRASKKDFELVKEIGLKETGILVSCSDYHIFYKMKMTRKQALEHYLGVVRECLETGISPRCHLEDITRSDIYGFVIPFCLELMKLKDEYGIPVKIRACDTMGYGVNFPGAVIPRSVPGIIYGLKEHAGVPSELLEWHGHNDFYKALTIPPQLALRDTRCK